VPDIDGKDVISTIRQWEFENEKYKAGKEVKILMISAMEDSKNIMGSFREGCEAYLVKPVNADNLKKTLADLDIKA
jgi:two-component system chemotaxis response regulator CheY